VPTVVARFAGCEREAFVGSIVAAPIAGSLVPGESAVVSVSAAVA
jgi:hypothetical protein